MISTIIGKTVGFAINTTVSVGKAIGKGVIRLIPKGSKTKKNVKSGKSGKIGKSRKSGKSKSTQKKR